ncbi:hypothetical protein [Olleya namhaensis]|uniref:hypothetical protein n=1 Tax=Olleya namhaensis TaxID=1144750 RepID=UPI00232FCA37|nr:hypothetical protein [Olleya namhaensis]
MNRLLILFFSLSIIGCSKQKKIWDNGLTKSAEEITEYTIRIQEDSLKNQIRDTLLIAVKKYRDDDQIAFQTRRTLFDNEHMEIEYVYDSSDRLKQEIVKMSTDSLPIKVNYSYKNSLLFQSSGIMDNATERFEQIETHYYRNDKTKEKSIMRQIFIDKETNDTIRNSTVSTFFNTSEKVDSILSINLRRQGQNRKSVYEFDGKNFIGLKEYNETDSLLSNQKFEYKMDEFDNWTEKKVIENGTLKRIIIRKIKYK